MEYFLGDGFFWCALVLCVLYYRLRICILVASFDESAYAWVYTMWSKNAPTSEM